MYVEKLRIQNFRRFAETEVELNYPGREPTPARPVPPRLPNVNVFLGNNGSGKSSVFKALCLGILAPVIVNSGFRAEFLVRRRPQAENPRSPNTIAPLEEDLAEVRTWLRLDRLDSDDPAESHSLLGRAIIQRFGDVEQILTSELDRNQWRFIFENDSPAFFVTGYGASRRTERPEGYSEAARARRYQRVASLFEEHVGLTPFSLGYLRLQSRGRLDEARSLLNRFLPGGIELTSEIDSQDRPLFLVEDVFLPYDALSDGYRAFIGWVWDLLIQLAALKPPPEMGQPALADYPGAVVVDEIDLFLHPEWQRTVVEQLGSVLPNLQFFFSTHSPLVAGALLPEHLFMLEDEGIAQYQESVYGLTPNQILTSSYFGLRSTRAPLTGTLDNVVSGPADGTDASAEQAEPRDRFLTAPERAEAMLAELEAEA